MNATENILKFINKVFVKTEKGMYLVEPKKGERATRETQQPNAQTPHIRPDKK